LLEAMISFHSAVYGVLSSDVDSELFRNTISLSAIFG